ncbi:MAG: SspB family protein [Variibacter sp.]
MAVDHIRYDLLVRGALRDVVRGVLADVARNGLPGDHHFYVAFDTRVEGVGISSRLRTQYPEEMTIVLQHQFWDLKVSEIGFEVGLSFNGVPERLVVPFDALKGFADPSVQFGLEFEVALDKTKDGEPALPATDAKPGAARSKPQRAENEKDTKPVSAPAPAPLPAAENDSEPGKPSGGAEVVRLDRFRKK